MRFAPFFWKGKGKAAVALGVLLLMATFLAFYRTYMCSIEPVAEVSAVEIIVLPTAPDPTLAANPDPDTPEQQMHQALTEQTIILQEISEDVDAVNQSLDEITVLLQEEGSR